jgi:hypothetical protein
MTYQPISAADYYAPDPRRSAALADVGAPDYIAATMIDTDGSWYPMLARIDALGDPTAIVDATCAHVAYEQLGPVPIELLRAITIAYRQHLAERQREQ